MKHITKTIETLKYGYTRGEFMPIFQDGELSNKREFVKYKVRCILVKKTLC